MVLVLFDQWYIGLNSPSVANIATPFSERSAVYKMILLVQHYHINSMEDSEHVFISANHVVDSWIREILDYTKTSNINNP